MECPYKVMTADFTDGSGCFICSYPNVPSTGDLGSAIPALPDRLLSPPEWKSNLSLPYSEFTDDFSCLLMLLSVIVWLRCMPLRS